jgi:PLP dependent protein
MPVDIERNLDIVRNRILNACKRSGRNIDDVTLIAVTKGVSAADIRRAYELGIRNFGENRVQEAELKMAELTSLKPNVCWHMIGHLQSNKARLAVKLFGTIQSVDTLKLAEILNQSTFNLPILLEANVSGEKTKSGFTEMELIESFAALKDMKNLNITGLMTVAPVTGHDTDARPVFRRLRDLAGQLGLRQLSMGMTDDFEVAIEEGATFIRLGRAIFNIRRTA